MKQNPHILGVDDAPFARGQEMVGVVGVLVKAPMYVERVMRETVEVDGTDGTDALIRLAGPGVRETVQAMMVDGICMGGFNVIDLGRLHRETGLPVVTISDKEPDIPSMVSALRKHFPDWEERAALLERVPLFPVKVGRHTIHCCAVGMDANDVAELVRLTVVQGAIPEPVRLAHVIAGGTLDERDGGGR